MFTFDDKQYDETKLNQEGKAAYANLQLIANQEVDIQVKANHIAVLKAHYTNVLKEHLPIVQEVKKEEPKEEKKKKK